ncbi:MAG: hypothetical protein PVI63_04710 [Anaerolineae bacterium]
MSWQDRSGGSPEGGFATAGTDDGSAEQGAESSRAAGVAETLLG